MWSGYMLEIMRLISPVSVGIREKTAPSTYSIWIFHSGNLNSDRKKKKLYKDYEEQACCCERVCSISVVPVREEVLLMALEMNAERFQSPGVFLVCPCLSLCLSPCHLTQILNHRCLFHPDIFKHKSKRDKGFNIIIDLEQKLRKFVFVIEAMNLLRAKNPVYIPHLMEPYL